MADHEDFDDDLLDSALDDFRGVSGLSAKSSGGGGSQSSAVTKATLGQGLGTGLPSLTSGKKRAGGKGSKDKHVGGEGGQSGRPAKPEATSLSATLQKLADQTRNTVENIDAAPAEADDMESFVKQFEALGGSQDMQGLMDTMMRQLLSKEVLYEPMKEIGERYPEWLETHKAELSSEDRARYMRQYDFIKQLCHAYETTPDDFPKVVDLMQSMQECGQPPPDIVRELAPGLELGEDGLPVLPDFSGADPLGGPGNCSIM